MCVIVFKPKGERITKKIIDQCIKANPHGGGIAYTNKKGNAVINHRGLQTVEDFWKRLPKIQENYDIALHFRIATSGEINLLNCHPFPVPYNEDLIEKNTFHSKASLMHNGFFDVDWDASESIHFFSDTLLLIKDILSYMTSYWAQKFLLQEIASITNSHFAFINTNPNQPIKLIGKFKPYKGLLCSNLNFTYKKLRKSNKRVWTNYPANASTYTTKDAKSGKAKYVTVSLQDLDEKIEHEEHIATGVPCRICEVELLQHEVPYMVCDDCTDIYDNITAAS